MSLFVLLVMSALGFKARVDSLHVFSSACNGFLRFTCRPLDGQHGSQSRFLHACSKARMLGFDSQQYGQKWYHSYHCILTSSSTSSVDRMPRSTQVTVTNIVRYCIFAVVTTLQVQKVQHAAKLSCFILSLEKIILIKKKNSVSPKEKSRIEFFLNNTNLTFLTFLYKIYITGFQNQQK